MKGVFSLISDIFKKRRKNEVKRCLFFLSFYLFFSAPIFYLSFKNKNFEFFKERKKHTFIHYNVCNSAELGDPEKQNNERKNYDLIIKKRYRAFLIYLYICYNLLLVQDNRWKYVHGT